MPATEACKHVPCQLIGPHQGRRHMYLPSGSRAAVVWSDEEEYPGE